MKQILYGLLLASVACLLGNSSVEAQQLGRSEAGTAEQRLVEDLGPQWKDVPAGLPANLQLLQNLSDIQQRGDRNKASTMQTNPGTGANQAFIMQVGDRNLAAITQTGSSNYSRIDQSGNRNETSVLQYGDGNHITSTETGDRNKSTLKQLGDNNYFENVVSGRKEVSITQEGNNNRLVQQGTAGIEAPRYEIEMRGNGINLTIEHGRIGQ